MLCESLLQYLYYIHSEYQTEFGLLQPSQKGRWAVIWLVRLVSLVRWSKYRHMAVRACMQIDMEGLVCSSTVAREFKKSLPCSVIRSINIANALLFYVYPDLPVTEYLLENCKRCTVNTIPYIQVHLGNARSSAMNLSGCLHLTSISDSPPPLDKHWPTSRSDCQPTCLTCLCGALVLTRYRNTVLACEMVLPHNQTPVGDRFHQSRSSLGERWWEIHATMWAWQT